MKNTKGNRRARVASGPQRAAKAASTNNAKLASQVNTLRQKIDQIGKAIPKGTFSTLGQTAGGALGGPLGATLGHLAGKGLSAITGYGDYEVKSNTLATVATSMDSVPQFFRNDHTVRIRHREYVKDLTVPTTPSAFTLETFALNPGNQDLFPWLASISKSYQQYKVRGMVVEYKSMTSDYAAAGPLGTVVIASNYNVVDSPYDNKIDMENSEFAVSARCSQSILHAIECAPKTGRDDFLFVRDTGNENILATNDARFYDLASLQVATVGLPGSAGNVLGELWVSYDIEFTKPIVPSSPPGTSQICEIRATAPTIANSLGKVGTRNATLLVGDDTLLSSELDPSSTAAMSLSSTTNSPGNSTFTVLKTGYYRFVYSAVIVGTANSTAPTVFTMGTGTTAPIMIDEHAGCSSTRACIDVFVYCGPGSVGGTITINGGAATTWGLTSVTVMKMTF
jgi:hypothetical protein